MTASTYDVDVGGTGRDLRPIPGARRIALRLDLRLGGLQSKRPQVKTSPSQNVPDLVKMSPKIGQNVPMVKNVGRNVPKMIFYSIFYEILGIIWDV